MLAALKEDILAAIDLAKQQAVVLAGVNDKLIALTEAFVKMSAAVAEATALLSEQTAG